MQQDISENSSLIEKEIKLPFNMVLQKQLITTSNPLTHHFKSLFSPRVYLHFDECEETKYFVRPTNKTTKSQIDI